MIFLKHGVEGEKNVFTSLARKMLQFRKEHLQQKLFTSLFQHHAMLEISYEDLAQHPDVILNDVQQFLGVKPQQLKTLLKKQNQDSVKTHVTNYDEVQKLSMLA